MFVLRYEMVKCLPDVSIVVSICCFIINSQCRFRLHTVTTSPRHTRLGSHIARLGKHARLAPSDVEILSFTHLHYCRFVPGLPLWRSVNNLAFLTDFNAYWFVWMLVVLV